VIAVWTGFTCIPTLPLFARISITIKKKKITFKKDFLKRIIIPKQYQGYWTLKDLIYLFILFVQCSALCTSWPANSGPVKHYGHNVTLFFLLFLLICF
jgi:hypothetical protein